MAVLVEQLYAAVGENAKQPKVKKNVKHVIDAFMNDDMEDDETEVVEGLWYSYIPFKKLTTMRGDPAVEKQWWL